MNLYQHGALKFPNAGLLASSSGRGWQGVAAELRAHPAGNLPAVLPSQVEITLAIEGGNGAVSRKGNGVRQVTRVEPGTLWLCPVGVGEDDTNISADLPEILHIYLSEENFQSLSRQYGNIRVNGSSVRYLADVDDALIRQLGLSILTELRQETSAGRLLVESSALALTARLVQSHGHESLNSLFNGEDKACPTRIARVVDYIRSNLEGDLTMDELAGVACLSSFHFARMFKQVTGKTPHHYVSNQRLGRAKSLLLDGGVSFAEIALRSGFSTQASFNRSFRQAEGCSPSQYLGRRRS